MDAFFFPSENPLAGDFECPRPLLGLLARLRAEFHWTGHFADDGVGPAIFEPPEAPKILEMACTTVGVYVARAIARDIETDSLLDLTHLQDPYAWPLSVADSLCTLLEEIEENDECPPVTSISTGILYPRNHIAAVAIFQLYSAVQSLKAGSIQELAELLCDVGVLLAHLQLIDSEFLLRHYEDLPRRMAQSHGSLGGKKRHRLASELKAWALTESQGVRGADIEIARELASRLPNNLIDAVLDPERVIYDALRASRTKAARG